MSSAVFEVVAAVLVGFVIGIVFGVWLTISLLSSAFKEGRWSRDEMQKLLGKWRGPNGETW